MDAAFKTNGKSVNHLTTTKCCSLGNLTCFTVQYRCMLMMIECFDSINRCETWKSNHNFAERESLNFTTQSIRTKHQTLNK